MKKIVVLLFWMMVITIGYAQQANIRIAGTRLTYPLVQKWIDEYAKINHAIKIEIAQQVPADSLDLQIISHSLSSEDLKGRQAVALGRYAQLPIVNSQRADLAQIQSTGFAEKDFKQIYFSHNAPVASFAVYKREKPACASIAFANHFGSQQKDISGVGVKGDDKDLLNAVKRDISAVSFNNLGFIYNLKTRKVTDSVAVVPIDLNNDGKIDVQENLCDDLDKVIAFAEKNTASIPVENVYGLFNKDAKNKADLVAFLKWVTAKGQAYNHAYGFLQLTAVELQNISQLLSNTTFHCTPKGKLLVQNSLSKSADKK